MTRPRRARETRDNDLTDGEWAFLIGADKPPGTPSEEWWCLESDNAVFRDGRPAVAELWATYAADVLEVWTAALPGTRPPLWWRYDVPEPGRCRLGGIGTPANECTAIMLRLTRGVPADWLWPPDAAEWPDLIGCLVSLADPPAFESEATYLDRHGLFLPGERERLTAAAFEPWRLGDPAPALDGDDD
jgi:hypothetical protein